MLQQFVIFIVLQVLDLITTLYFVRHGGAEGNPIALRLANLAPSFEFGLLIIKAWAILIGYWLYKGGGYKFLKFTNAVFVLIVVWNLAGIFLNWLGR